MLHYNAETNTITLRAGPPVRLGDIGRVLQRPDLLHEEASGQWLLAANLRVEAGATLDIAAPDVTWLKLRSDPQTFVWIKVFGGVLRFTNTCISSWDSAQNGVDENYSDGRSFVLARNGARMDIHGSELRYLGYAANESYGVAWRLAGTTGTITNSRFAYNYYGLYTYEASNLIIRDNEVHHSVLYGIDPHTSSDWLLIEGNRAYNNGKHGIILAEGCKHSIIRNNIVYANQLHGIVLYQGSNHNLVEGNTTYDNGQQGININASADNIVHGNTVYANGSDGIGVGKGSRNNNIVGNTVYSNQQHGIYLYTEAENNTLRDNTVRDNQHYGVYVKSKGNRLASGNIVFGNRIGVYILGDPVDQAVDATNHIHDNREANLRSGD